MSSAMLFVLTLLFALPLGLIISFGSMSKFKPIRLPVRVLVWIVRGSPLMIQLLIVFYGPGLLFGWKTLPRFTAALVAFVINQIGGIFTGAVSIIGLIIAILVIALAVYLLVRPYKESTKLNSKVVS